MDTLCSRMLLVLALTPLLALATPTPPTHDFMLDNGLKVIVREDHRAPLVTTQLWFKVGSSDESPGHTGLSHALEHMLYKGSSKLCSGEAAAILESLGAAENAFTGQHVTAYHQTLATQYLGVAFELMADLMSTAHLRTEELIPEMAVIREERRLRVDDDPMETALERLSTLAFPSSGLRTPVIGWMNDLYRLTASDLRDWYQSRYAPGNAVLVIVGDVTLEQVKPLARRWFGAIASRPFPAMQPMRELPEPGERQVTLHLPVHAPELIMAFNVPGQVTATASRTVYALRLIEMLLAGSPSARLQKRLQFQEGLFSKVEADYTPHTRGDSLLTLTARLTDSNTASLDAAQTRIWQMLDELRATAPGADELERARTQLIARQIYTRDFIEHTAHQLALLESSGLPWQLLDQDIEELKKVTPADIRRTAETYLTRERLSTAHVLVKEAGHE
ncbi:M16 family metallopeptidase [Pseudomonas botevensis]|uniref:M16 family metallopeptidase n=1 Tax=Pseudomonas botevensis TaxID=2842352 RepID=UPI001C3D29D6|nr:pitrilysin family protein [Pseudomonas botevensis]MBV4473021.1 insulinase family protein [Pseudomonas botevensis]